MMWDATSEVAQLDSSLLPTTSFRSVESNSTLEEEVEEQPEQPEQELLPTMASDFKEQLNLPHMEMALTQPLMLSTEMDASSLTPTKVLDSGGKLNSEATTKSISSKSETDGTAVEADLLASKFTSEQPCVVKLRMEPKTEDGIKSDAMPEVDSSSLWPPEMSTFLFQASKSTLVKDREEAEEQSEEIEVAEEAEVAEDPSVVDGWEDKISPCHLLTAKTSMLLNASKVVLLSPTKVLDNGGKSSWEDNTTLSRSDSETERTAVVKDSQEQRFSLMVKLAVKCQPRLKPTNGMMWDATSEVAQLDSSQLPTTSFRSVESNSTLEEEVEEQPEQELHQQHYMVWD